MNIQPQGILSKTLFIVCAVVLALTTILAATSYRLVTRQFSSLENDEARVNLERVINELENARKALDAKVADWAPWDETSAFIGGTNNDYVANNLSVETFQTLQLHFMLFFDAKSALVHQVFYDQEAQQTVAPDNAVVEAVRLLPQLLQHDSVKDTKSGLVLTSSGPVLLASAPIVTSTFQGPIRGTLIFGCYIDAHKVKQIGESTRLAVEMHPYQDKRQMFRDAAVQTLADAGHAAANPFVAQASDDQVMHGYVQVNDVTGAPAIVLSISQPRTIFRQGLAMWREHVLALAGMGGLFVLLLVLLLHRGILRHLTRLTEEVQTIGREGRHDLRVAATTADEIGELAAQINGMLGSLQKLQNLRRDNEQHLHHILDSINCGVMIVEAEGQRIVSVNTTGATLLGRAPEEIVGKVCAQMVCPGEERPCSLPDASQPTPLCVCSIQRADGSQLPVLKSVSLIERNGQRHRVESFIDVSELKKTQLELQASEIKYRQFFDDDLTGNFISSVDGLILDCNRAFATMLGYQSVAEAQGVNIRAHYFSPEHRAALLDRLQHQGKIERHQGAMQRLDGQVVYCVCTLIGEFDQQGVLVQTRGHLFDDSKRVLLEREIRQAQKMEAIGALAGGIAHDFNNILAGMMGYTEIVMRNLNEVPDSKNQRNLSHILAAGERARDLIQKILTFSRQTETDQRPIRVQRTVDDVLQLIRASLPATIAIEPQYNSQATVLADPIQIHQVFMNLCANAGHAMKEQGGILSVRLDDMVLDDRFAALYPEITPGDFVRIEIADTGQGIPAHLMDRIFDPFFTTKKKGEGTGLGLSMVHGIVSGMHGLILVDSQPGQGARFTLYLPRIKEEEAMDPVAHQAIPTGREHVVYVDDEEFLVDVGSEILRGLGYQVTGFTDSGEALRFVQARAPEVDLVVSDMTMPKLTGLELAQSLQQLDSPPPVIICTGHNEGQTKAELATMGIHDLLLKPVTVNKLAVTVRAVLDNHRQR
ncbi:CHASE4 domain-containing protein [Desulfobulbus sp.]|uniref:CHASE4 domain-containing protein n=1 Tax=Desulfobulbus sp. TaxID=895 RepID=UPI0027B8F85D|nr:CHASE4 domain-containing protein [Desulfobulbus sp.]